MAQAEGSWFEDADFAVMVSDEATQRGSDPRELVARAVDAGCDGLYPGWDGLGRHVLLAEGIQQSGLAYVGPTTRQLVAVADRTVLRNLAQDLEIPVVPGSDALTDPSQAEAWLAWTGLPAVVKAVDARGARRSVRVETMEEAAAAIITAAKFGAVYLERSVVGARVIEVPMIGDGEGAILALGDREATIRNEHRVLLAESTTSDLSGEVRGRSHGMPRRSPPDSTGMEW